MTRAPFPLARALQSLPTAHTMSETHPARRAAGIGEVAAAALALARALVRRPRVHLLQPCGEVRPPPRTPGALHRCFQREAHHHIRRGQLLAGKPGPLRQLVLDIVQMHIDHRLELPDRRLPEQGHAAQHQHGEQRRHQRALGIMQEVAIAQRIGAVARHARLVP